jgi:predicted ATP-dependent serine protease
LQAQLAGRLRGWSDEALSVRPLVGRVAELRQIDGLLEGGPASHSGQILLMRGEAGIGKTRLLAEMIRRDALRYCALR